MTRKELIESDEYWNEIIENMISDKSLSKKTIIEMIIDKKNELIQFSQPNRRTEIELRQYLLNWHNGDTNFSIQEFIKWLYNE